MKQPYDDCPRYQRCAANLCPLDPDKDERCCLPGEDRCSLGKARRMRIAAQYLDLLPWGGLWDREISAKARWDARSEQDKAAIIARISGREPT